MQNVKFDETVHQFQLSKSKTSATSPCTALAFTAGVFSNRSRLSEDLFCLGTQLPLMASGGLRGEIVIWQLKDKELFCMKPDAHSSRIVHLTTTASER